MSDLVERLQNRITTHCAVQPTHLHMPNYSEGRKLLEEAATALTAKDKEIEALRADVTRWKDEHACSEINFQRALARADTAERVFEDILDELGCERNNEAALQAIAVLKASVAALRCRAETAERERDCHKQMADKNYALWAEVSRERDEARAALKPMIPLAEDTAKKLRQCGSPMADQIDQLARAASAVIEKGE